MREFYIYGFRNRNEYDAKSARTYDDERRRIESWLGDYMSFHYTEDGKAYFISVDSRNVIQNPLYKAFKSCSFTDNDIVLHFFLLDLLEEGEWLSKNDIARRLSEEYYMRAWDLDKCDERIPTPETIDKKLKEYARRGLLEAKTEKRKIFYRLSEDGVDSEAWKDAVSFFSEVSPVGIVGSLLLDRPEFQCGKEVFGFKHHFLLYAIDSEIIYKLACAIETRSVAKITKVSNTKRERAHEVVPLKIFLSTQGGRSYLLCHRLESGKLMFYRIDRLLSVEMVRACDHWDDYLDEYERAKPNLWGVNIGQDKDIVHLELTLRIESDEGFMLNRLEREKRNGVLQKLSENTYRYAVNTYDAMELMPWIRTFTGRVVSLECDNAGIEKRFKDDLEKMYELYLEDRQSGS